MSGASGPEASPEPSEGGGRALKLQTDTPHLVNIGGDRLSTSVTLHPIPQGRVTLGCGPGVDIPVQGTGVLPMHCHIENSEGVVTIYPLSDNLSIDGVKIGGPTRLSQGVMLTIGRSNYMRFNHPAEAKIMKSVLPNPRISMAPITFEPNTDASTFQTPKFTKKPPAVPKKNSKESLIIESGVEEPTPSSIMTKVSKFEYLAQQNFKKSISPKVFSSNLVTVNTPARDVLGKSPPDIQNYTKSLPRNVLNYTELNYNNEKDQDKTQERVIFAGKRAQPQYVNVSVNNDNKYINNRVIIYENGCIPKNQNQNHHVLSADQQNDLFLNNKSSNNGNKNINTANANIGNQNVNKIKTPSPGYNRNPGPLYRSVTPSPVSGVSKMDFGKSGSLGELSGCLENLEQLVQRNNDAEWKRKQAQKERLEEQETKKIEEARLEEILNMCVEYEKQSSAQTEKNKIIPNRIKTNGSLPRDKRLYAHSPVFTTPPSSPREVDFSNSNDAIRSRNHSYENVSLGSYHTSRENVNNSNYENYEIPKENINGLRGQNCVSPYENVQLSQQNLGMSQSPRTRIKTIVPASNREHSTPKETAEVIENKFAILEAEHNLLQNLSYPEKSPLSPDNKMHIQNTSTTPQTKFIFPLEEPSEITPPSHTVTVVSQPQTRGADDEEQERKLRLRKRDLTNRMSLIKRQISETENQEEELLGEMEFECALLSGEHQSKLLELDKVRRKKERLIDSARKIEEKMQRGQARQEEDQKVCKRKLEQAQDRMDEAEASLSKITKDDQSYENIFEDYLKAQEILDNERKAFEDLEFHHLEEEADFLASREEIQREILDLSKRIDDLKVQLEDLEQQKYKIKSSNSDLKVLKKRRIEFLLQLEKMGNAIRTVDDQLAIFTNQESDESDSSSDSDKSKDLEKQISSLSLNHINSEHIIHDLSCSVIVSNSKASTNNFYNMSQSFNEKLLQEKSILESGQRFPSQDDIDRISKVTSDAPINYDEDQGSLGRKTIESLKDIERKRHLHLCQQGSQVIEQERQRVLALKQRVQQEVRNNWAQRRTDNDSMESDVLEDTRRNSYSSSKEVVTDGNKESPSQDNNTTTTLAQHNDSILRSSSDGGESPRPMSEISEMSVEGGTAHRKRQRTPSDKQRPLTRYLPIRGSDLDLLQHIASAGHQVVLCPHVIINSNTCRGFLHKKGSKLNGWSKRWFVFDRSKHTFTYYNDKSEKKPKGGAYFQAIEEVYLDHLNSVKSPNPQLTFIVKTHERFYYLMAPSPEAMRIWVDVIFTGAEGYREFDHGT